MATTTIEIREKYQLISNQFSRLHRLYHPPALTAKQIDRLQAIFKKLQERHYRLMAQCAHSDFWACQTGHGICPDCGYRD